MGQGLSDRATVWTGLDVLAAEGHPALVGARVGLVTNHTGVDRRLRHGIDILRGRLRLAALFAPEHGIRGEAQAGAPIGASVDARTGLPVHSLYGESRRPRAESLRSLDALLFDVQDVGVRYATYASTCLLCLEAAAEAGVPLVILDRPNPLGGVVEGSILDPAFASFVGAHPVPIRHGLTIGELARLAAAERGLPDPVVVPIRDWRREVWQDETGLPWVQPSPNLPTLDSLTLYPGTCLIEGTSVSEGRGTTRPFELVGAPWLDAHALADELTARALPGVAFRPAWFVPSFSKHAGVTCAGVQIHVLDRRAIRSVDLGLHLIDALRWVGGSDFAWRTDGEGGYFVDRLLGSDRPRRLLERGAGVADITAGWRDEIAAFERRASAYKLYG